MSPFSPILARPARLLVLAALGLGAAPALAIDRLWLDIGDVEAAFGTAAGVRVAIELRAGGEPAVSLRAREVLLPIGRLTGVRADCAAFAREAGRIACRDARITVSSSPLAGAQDFRADLVYDSRSGRVDIEARGVDLASADLDVDLEGTTSDWKIAVRGDGLDAAALALLAREAGLVDAQPEIGGRVDIDLQLSGAGLEPRSIEATIGSADLSGSDASGRLAMESLALTLDGELTATDGGWRFDIEARSDGGQLYVEPWFVEPGKEKLALSAHGAYSAGGATLETWSLQQEGVLEASGSARVTIVPQPRLAGAEIRIADARFPDAYRIWLQPYLYGGAFEALATSGQIDGEIVLAGGAARRIALDAHDLSIDDTRKRFAVYGLDGSLRWSAEGPTEDSRLAWEGGFVYGIGFGPATVAVEAAGRSIELLEPLVVPVLDGRLLVRELAVDRFGRPELEIAFDAELEPLDLRSLTTALDWPSMSGELSGRIPSLSYADGVMTLGGDLRAEVFDGTITVQNLQMRDPFGSLPRLAADVRVRGLDLDLVTDIFEIGRIEGGLDGDVENLRLFRWRPVAFDARFHTPADDELPHRISQRAVESLSSLGGGGATAALSSGFLQFFENFAYRRLGLGCRLENEVCHMRGVGPAPSGGYYIVEGKWLPRIDVIGHESRVDWPVLLEQLASLAEADSVVVGQPDTMRPNDPQ